VPVRGRMNDGALHEGVDKRLAAGQGLGQHLAA
jgi:hypothetical protein